MLSDAELVQVAQRGDVTSLGVLLERHRASVQALALRLLGSSPDAHDAVHDAFLIALLGIESLRQPEAAGAWLRGIVRNVCLTRLRRRRRETLFSEVPSVAERGPHEPSPEEFIDRLALRDWVWTALASLPEPLRVTAILRYFGKYASYEEVAIILGVPVGTVRSRLNQVKVKLAEALLETAALAHDEARHISEFQDQYFRAAFNEYNRGDGYGMFANAFSEDCVIGLSNGCIHHGRDWVIEEGEGDLEVGMKLHITNVMASREVTVIEGDYENPPDDPFRCPPAISVVSFYRGGKMDRVRMYFPPRPVDELTGGM